MNDYEKYLEDKSEQDIWRKAKQREYNNLDSILLSLANPSSLTWRNAMTLRILGLISKPDEGSSLEVGVTNVGKDLLASSNKQRVLDEQLLKIYLDSYVNTSLNIAVQPMAVIYRIIMECGYITFEEYRMFVCWINSSSEIQKAIDLIKAHRSADQKEQDYSSSVLSKKIKELGYKDFDDNIYRLFAMFKLSSFITTERDHGKGSDRLIANSGAEVYKSLIESASKLDISNYEDIHVNVLDIIKTSAEYADITEEISSLTTDEQRLIKEQIKERNELPSISDVEPKVIAAEFIQQATRKPISKRVSQVKKIDYEERNKRNRLVGAYGEKIVFKYEYTKLIKAGKEDLASKIEHSSLTDDTLGYDVSSYEVDGQEKHIEVKTVTGKPKTINFYISSNELEKVRTDKAHCVYIVFDYQSTSPSILEISDLLAVVQKGKAKITPVNYMATITLSYE